MKGETRLDKLYPVLSAKERALLVLRALREGRDEDPQVRGTIPPWQGREFNRLIGLLNAANCELGAVLLLLQEQVTQLDLRYAWLLTLRLWGDQAARLRGYLDACTKEPITRGDLRRLKVEAAAEWLPLDACAEIAVEEHQGWAAEDYVESEGGREVSDVAWGRVLRQREATLRRLAAEGKLVARGKGGRLRIQAGAFYGWLGLDVPVVPDWGMEHDVYPDRERKHVESLLTLRRHAQDELARAPGRLDGPLDPERPPAEESYGPGFGDELARALVRVLRDGVRARWGELRAIEVTVAEVAEEFDGEPVLQPEVQELADGIRARLAELHAGVAPLAGPFELAEPGEDDVALARKLITLAAGR